MASASNAAGEATVQFIKRLLIGLVILVGAGLAAMYVADPILTTRLVRLPFGGGSGPEETVSGGPAAVLPVAAAGKGSIAAAALDAAVEYGAQTGSQALIVYHDGAIQLEHYYPGYDASTRTPTQSMHKSVLALVVGIAIRDGFIHSIDDPAARYLPEWANDARAKISLRDLLHQASGLDFPTVGFNPVGGFFELMLGADIAPIALGQPAVEAPGTRFDYNSINPEVLGLVLERATGRRYASYLSDALWKRIGASDAAVVLDSEEKGVPRFFCCLNATARSWLQIGLLHIHAGQWNGEQVVPADWIRDIQAPSAAYPNYGYLTWLGNQYEAQRHYNHKTRTSVRQSAPFAAPDLVYFDGFGGQRVYAVPSLGLVIVRTGALATDWDEARLPNLVIGGIGAPAP